jgi:acetyl-CoA C-acetyltransferase
MEQAVIVSAVRTPVGSFGGYFKDVGAPELGSHAIRAALERAQVAPEDVEEVILGCVLQAGLGQNPARQAALGAGLPVEVPGTTINMLCGSGLKSVTLASQMIRAGDADIVVAGGMENMSRAPYLVTTNRFGAKMGDVVMLDSMTHDGLFDAFEHVHMGITAENVADEYGISREDQDEFAALSQQKAERAIEAGVFKDEIVPIEIPQKRGDPRVLDNDEHPRAGTTIETLAGLRAAFRKDGGTVTAGNASGVNDGAAAIVVMSARCARERGLTPLGVVESYASVGVEPRIMGIGPIPAIRKALVKVNLSIAEIDLFEVNEAFASQSLAVRRELGLPEDRVNPHGGAIALGHPIGASGGRILVTLLHEMRRGELERGVASLCVGGGQGQAAVIHRANGSL